MNKIKVGLIIIDTDEIIWAYKSTDGLWIGCRMAEAVKVTGEEAERLWALLTAGLVDGDAPQDKPPKRGKGWK